MINYEYKLKYVKNVGVLTPKGAKGVTLTINVRLSVLSLAKSCLSLTNV